MAHEIEQGQNGEYHFFEVGAERSAWHRLGNLIQRGLKSIDEVFAAAPWLSYPVEKMPVTLTLKTPDGDTYTKASEKAFVTVRTDTNAELGSVGPDYVAVQNSDAFRATIGPLVDQGVLRIETGGVLRDGADAWLLGSFDVEQFGPVVREVFADEVLPYALVKVNHAGRRNNEIALTPIRVVCANTLGMAEQEIDGGHTARAASIRHTGEAEAKMVAAAQELFGGIIERYETVAKAYRKLKGTYLDLAMLRSLVVQPVIGVHPTQRDEFNPDARMAERVIERYEKRRDTIETLWMTGKGHKGDGSAWEAYNGVVEAIDHNEDVFPSRSGVYRLGALMDGELRKKKDTALRGLQRYADALESGDRDAIYDLIGDANERAQLVLAK